MSVAFWSQIVKPGESEDVQPPEGYVLNVQNIALTGSKSEKDSAQVFAKTLSVDGEMSTTLLGTLRPMACDQFQTQLVFGFDVPVTFVVESSNSKVSVHMSGYYQPGPDDEEEEDSEEEYDSDENMEVYQNLVSSGGMDGFPVGDEDSEDEEESEDEDKEETKGRVQQLDSEEDSGDNTSSDEEDAALDAAFIAKMVGKNEGKSKASAHEEEPQKKKQKGGNKDKKKEKEESIKKEDTPTPSKKDKKKNNKKK